MRAWNQHVSAGPSALAVEQTLWRHREVTMTCACGARHTLDVKEVVATADGLRSTLEFRPSSGSAAKEDDAATLLADVALAAELARQAGWSVTFSGPAVTSASCPACSSAPGSSRPPK